MIDRHRNCRFRLLALTFFSFFHLRVAFFHATGWPQDSWNYTVSDLAAHLSRQHTMRPLSLPSQGPPRLPVRPSLSARASSPTAVPVSVGNDSSAEVSEQQWAPPTTMRLLSLQEKRAPANGDGDDDDGDDDTRGTRDTTSGTPENVLTEVPVLPKRPSLPTDLSLQENQEDTFTNLSEFFCMNPVSGATTRSSLNSNMSKNVTETPPRQLQPLNLTLPSIMSVANKGVYGASSNNGANNNNNTGTTASNSGNKGMNTSGKGNAGRKNAGGNEHGNSKNNTGNKFYIRLLEDVHLDDQSVLFDLMDTLMQVRSENEKLKEGLWSKIDSLSTAANKKVSNSQREDSTRYEQNSLMFDSKLSNDELKKMLHDQRTYNSVLAQTVDDFQDSLDSILNALVASNKEAGTELISSIEKGEAAVEQNSDEMWRSWMEVVSAMEDVAKFDSSIANTIQGL